MHSVTFNLPNSLNQKTFDLKIYVAAKMYEDKLLSSGQAAKVAGLSKKTFIELMGRYGVSIFSLSEEDIKNDYENIL